MRIVLAGSGSFIARAIAAAAASRGLDWLGLPHDAPLDGILRPDDTLINCAIAPTFRSQPYDPGTDQDLKAARAAARAQAHFVMLSSRLVYDPAARWLAREGHGDGGGDTAYGRNKARSEIAVQQALDGRAGIFRLSNICGYEYDRERPRRSFFGLLLGSLKQKNTIFFDMNAATRRDFLPVETCAALLLDRAQDRTGGTWNMGSGMALACGDVAGWICEGFGSGELVCDPDVVRDEFLLSMEKWQAAHFPLPANKQALRDYCIGLGRRLKCEQS
jgi:nucleoside-diphosphate-sugar epimerase